jgi:hypothetical protein
LLIGEPTLLFGTGIFALFKTMDTPVAANCTSGEQFSSPEGQFFFSKDVLPILL